MTCKVAPCMPWKLFRGSPTASSGAGSATVEPPPSPRELCRALSDAISCVVALQAAPQAHGGVCPATAASEEVQRRLAAVRARLEQASSPQPLPATAVATAAGVPPPPASAPAGEEQQEGRELVAALLAADVPALLVACLGQLGFEGQKDVMRLFSALLRLTLPLGADEALIEYIQTHPKITQLLLDGSGHHGVFAHCAQMLRACTRYPQLVATVLQDGACRRLIDLARHDSFDISSEAFASLRELLLAQREVSASYLVANFGEFFADYHTLLQSETDYVVRRQALRLLGDVLLDRAFMEVMLVYVTNEHFLQIHMNLLRDDSKSIQFDAFHVFKIFVANPKKPPRVHSILYRNRDRLLKLLATITSKAADETVVAEDLRVVVTVIAALEAPPRLLGAAAGAGGKVPSHVPVASWA